MALKSFESHCKLHVMINLPNIKSSVKGNNTYKRQENKKIRIFLRKKRELSCQNSNERKKKFLANFSKLEIFSKNKIRERL